MLPQGKAVPVMLGAGALVLAVLPFFVGGYYLELGTYAFIAAMLALSLQLLVGCTGLVSLGHAAFYGLAAYTAKLQGRLQQTSS
jgi:branched-chain amino acid transport system permease protein